MERAKNLSAVKDWKEIYLTVILCFLSCLFAVSLFKNISYPLFWADESMTVMCGDRVLEYGYPKVHNGKNVLYDLRHTDPTLGIDEKTDAYIGGANWGQYYIAAVGVKLAELSDDIFAKTAIIRSLFALIGLAGLVILAYLGTQFFDSKQSKTVFLILFAFLELISVPLVLHLREARYYSLTVFFAALTVFAYSQYGILRKTKYPGFLALLPVSLFLLFFTFSPAYFIFLAAIFLFESLALAAHLILRRRETYARDSSTTKELFRDYLKVMLPLVLSLIAVSPLIVFFKTFHIAEEMAKFNILSSHIESLDMYLDNLSIIWRYLASSDFIYLAIFLKLCLYICFAVRRSDKAFHTLPVPITTFSHFLTILFIVYIISIAKIPNFLFTRYFITLQPVLALIVILDLAAIYDFLSRYPSYAILKSGVLTIFIGFVAFNISTNREHIEGHVYELFHQNKGPLDYVIPFIKNEYKDTEHLVIATNYEETSFMYYLDAKVIVGFVGNNLEEDSRTVPDIVLSRKGWPNFKDLFSGRDLFSTFLERDRYSRISFPIVDYPTNNIPELNWSPPYVHRFWPVETVNELLKLEIYLRM